MTLAATGSLDLAQAVAGLPVAVVLVLLSLAAWRLNSRGEILSGREHRETVAQMQIRITVAEDARDGALDEVRYWQSVALRALNVSEAALGRRDARE